MKTLSKTEYIRARIEPHVKKESEEIFKKIGLNMSDAIGIFLHQVNLHKGIPFSVNIPNERTKKSFEEDLSKSVKYTSTKEMFDDILN